MLGQQGPHRGVLMVATLDFTAAITPPPVHTIVEKLDFKVGVRLDDRGAVRDAGLIDLEIAHAAALITEIAVPLVLGAEAFKKGPGVARVEQFEPVFHEGTSASAASGARV